ncbi:hypothetical protein J7J56_06235 [candidate division WOR-3 bacterium]|nr:hypothetical protein [candidate division WOR-3 bacterium]
MVRWLFFYVSSVILGSWILTGCTQKWASPTTLKELEQVKQAAEAAEAKAAELEETRKYLEQERDTKRARVEALRKQIEKLGGKP